MKAYDVAIIGGGIIGITSAFFLSRLGQRVIVLEQGCIATRTTANSFAWINASSKAAKGDYHQLNARGLAGYNQLSQEFGEEPLGLNPCGQLYVVRTKDDTEYHDLRQRWQLLRERNYPTAWVEAKELLNLEPSISCNQEYEALYNFGELCLDAPRFSRFLAEQIKKEGGIVLENTEVLELDLSSSGHIRGLKTNIETLAAEKILLASGPNSADMLAQLTGFAGFANRFPLNKSPGLLLTTPDLSPRKLSRRVIYWEQTPDFRILPHFSGGWRMGADDTDGVIAKDDTVENRRAAAEDLLGRARERIMSFPENLTINDCSIGVGIRPVPEDGISIADILPGAENFFVVVTHSGVTLSPILGKLIAEFMVSGIRPRELLPYSLARFPGFR